MYRKTYKHFRLCEEDGKPVILGRGGMGITFKAEDTTLEKVVALKVISPDRLDDDDTKRLFLREAKSAAKLEHRNVAQVVFYDEVDGEVFYAMEYVEGSTVRDLVKKYGKLPSPTALEITRQVAQALAAAVDCNIIHRDIKPANVMVKKERDGALLVKLIDFGLAKSVKSDAEKTMTSGFHGTLPFSSPEQIRSDATDFRSDLYSTGITLWYMLTGKVPFSGGDLEIIRGHLEKELPMEHLEGQPGGLKSLLSFLLAKDPEKRPQSPDILLRLVQDCLDSLPQTSWDEIPTKGEGAVELAGFSTRRSDAGIDRLTRSKRRQHPHLEVEPADEITDKHDPHVEQMIRSVTSTQDMSVSESPPEAQKGRRLWLWVLLPLLLVGAAVGGYTVWEQQQTLPSPIPDEPPTPLMAENVVLDLQAVEPSEIQVHISGSTNVEHLLNQDQLQLVLPPGAVSVTASAEGYQSVTHDYTSDDSPLEWRISLAKVPVTPPSVPALVNVELRVPPPADSVSVKTLPNGPSHSSKVRDGLAAFELRPGGYEFSSFQNGKTLSRTNRSIQADSPDIQFALIPKKEPSPSRIKPSIPTRSPYEEFLAELDLFEGFNPSALRQALTREIETHRDLVNAESPGPEKEAQFWEWLADVGTAHKAVDITRLAANHLPQAATAQRTTWLGLPSPPRGSRLSITGSGIGKQPAMPGFPERLELVVDSRTAAVATLILVPPGPNGTSPFYIGDRELPIGFLAAYESLGRVRKPGFEYNGRVEWAANQKVQSQNTEPYDKASLSLGTQFANWINAMADRPAAYTLKGEHWSLSETTSFRLPTLAEWRVAAESGLDWDQVNQDLLQPQQRNPGLITANSLVWWFKRAPRIPGLNPAHPLGIHDLNGNLHDLCLDPQQNDGLYDYLAGGSIRTRSSVGLVPTHPIKRVEPRNPEPWVGFRLLLPIDVFRN